MEKLGDLIKNLQKLTVDVFTGRGSIWGSGHRYFETLQLKHLSLVPWWWSTGQRAFKSVNPSSILAKVYNLSLQIVAESNKNKEKEAGMAHLKIQGGWSVGADESTELWREVLLYGRLAVYFVWIQSFSVWPEWAIFGCSWQQILNQK